MKNTRRTQFIVVIVVGLALVLLVQGQVRSGLNRPFGPTLPVFGTAEPTYDNPYRRGSIEGEVEPAGLTEVASTINLESQARCGGPERMIILAIGVDTTEENLEGRADVIRIVRVDFVNPGITVLAFPRDLWVPVDGLEEQDIYETRVNSVFFYGNIYNAPGSGARLLAETLYRNFGLVVDRYMAVNMKVFVEAIDALGGVDVHLQEDVNGRTQGLPYFRAGWHHMGGETALQYSRIRFPDTDWDRIDRQTELLKALRKKGLKPGVFPQLPALVNSFLEELQTDMSLKDIYSLICLMPRIGENEISAYVIERSMVTPTITEGGANVMLPHEEEIRNFVASFVAGRLP